MTKRSFLASLLSVGAVGLLVAGCGGTNQRLNPLGDPNLPIGAVIFDNGRFIRVPVGAAGPVATPLNDPDVPVGATVTIADLVYVKAGPGEARLQGTNGKATPMGLVKKGPGVGVNRSQ